MIFHSTITILLIIIYTCNSAEWWYWSSECNADHVDDANIVLNNNTGMNTCRKAQQVFSNIDIDICSTYVQYTVNGNIDKSYLIFLENRKAGIDDAFTIDCIDNNTFIHAASSFTIIVRLDIFDLQCTNNILTFKRALPVDKLAGQSMQHMYKDQEFRYIL